MSIIIGLLISIYLVSLGSALSELSDLYSSPSMETFGILCIIASVILFLSEIVYLILKHINKVKK